MDTAYVKTPSAVVYALMTWQLSMPPPGALHGLMARHAELLPMDLSNKNFEHTEFVKTFDLWCFVSTYIFQISGGNWAYSKTKIPAVHFFLHMKKQDAVAWSTLVFCNMDKIRLTTWDMNIPPSIWGFSIHCRGCGIGSPSFQYVTNFHAVRIPKILKHNP